MVTVYRLDANRVVSCRHHRRGDLRGGGGPGSGCQVPLPEERDLPEPGSEGGGQPGLAESLRGKQERVFYLTRLLTGNLQKGESLPVPPPPPPPRTLSANQSLTGSGSSSCETDDGTVSLFFLFLYKRVQTGADVS